MIPIKSILSIHLLDPEVENVQQWILYKGGWVGCDEPHLYGKKNKSWIGKWVTYDGSHLSKGKIMFRIFI